MIFLSLAGANTQNIVAFCGKKEMRSGSHKFQKTMKLFVRRVFKKLVLLFVIQILIQNKVSLFVCKCFMVH